MCFDCCWLFCCLVIFFWIRWDLFWLFWVFSLFFWILWFVLFLYIFWIVWIFDLFLLVLFVYDFLFFDWFCVNSFLNCFVFVQFVCDCFFCLGICLVFFDLFKFWIFWFFIFLIVCDCLWIVCRFCFLLLLDFFGMCVWIVWYFCLHCLWIRFEFVGVSFLFFICF